MQTRSPGDSGGEVGNFAPAERLFEPLIPGAVRGPNEPARALHMPEARLWVEVLRNAICEAGAPGVDWRTATRRTEARAWLESDEGHVGSYRWICEMLNLEPETLRRGILSRKHGLSAKQMILLSES